MSGASFYADPAVGGSGTTYEQSDFEAGTYVTQFFDALEDEVNIAQFVADTAADVAADALSAQNAAFTPATSAQTKTLASSGDVAFSDVGTGKTFPAGYKIRAASRANPSTHWMSGFVKTYTGGTLTITMTAKGSGTGDRADWDFSPAGEGAGDVESTRQISTSGLATGGGDLSADRTITVAAAVDTDMWAATSTSKAVTPDAVGDMMVSQSLSDGTTITPDFGAGRNFHVTLGGNRTLANPTNLAAGQSGRIRVTQDGTGNRTLAYGSKWKKPGGTLTLSTSASAVDILVYYVHDTNNIECNLIKALS